MAMPQPDSPTRKPSSGRRLAVAKTLTGLVAFAAGLALAQAGAETARLTLKSATLWQAMQEVHQRTHVNVVWAATEGSPRPVDVPLLSGSGTGERVAKAYGCELRRYGRVMTVFPALPEGEGPAKIHAARLWAESFGGSLQDTSRTLTEKAKSLSHSLPTGVHTVSSLSARDQATVYALARYGDMGDVAGQYASMFAFDAGTMKCGPKPQGDGAGATP